MRTDRNNYKSAARIVAGALVAAAAVGGSAARADVTKANNTNPLNLGTSYTGGTPPLATDKIIYDSTVTGPLSVAIGDDLAVNGLSFTTYVGAQTIAATPGKRLSIGAGGIVSTTATNSYDLTFNADLNLTASQAFFWNVANARTETMTFNGSITSAAGVDLTLGGGTTNTNSVIYQFGGTSSYTGRTILAAGSVRLGASNALPSTTVVEVGGVGSTFLILNGFNQTIAGLTTNANANTRRVINGTASANPSVLTINTPAGAAYTYVGSVGSNAASAAVDVNLAIVKTGGGLQELGNTAGGVVHTGPTTISGGALGVLLTLPPPPAVTNLSASNLVLDGGVLQNMTAASAFNRTFGSAAGQVQFGSNGGGFSAKGGTFTISLNNGSAAVDWLDAAGAGLRGTLKFGHESSTSDVNFTNAINLNGARTIDVADNPASALDFTTLNGVVANGTATGSLTKTGAGTLVLSTPNSYTGGTTINGGILTAAVSGAVPTAGGITVANTAALVVRTTGFDSTQAAALQGSATFLAGSGFGYDVPVTTTFTAPAGITGGAQLYKLGGGDLTLAGANSYTGGTTVQAGRLLLGDDAALGSGALMLGAASTLASSGTAARTVSAATTLAGATTFGGTAETGPLTFTNPVNTNGAGRILTVLANTTFAAGVNNGGINQKLGAGTLTVGGTSTMTGVTDVRDGTYVVNGTVNTNDGLRVMSVVSGGTATATVNGTYTIAATTGNVRIGQESANAAGVAATQTNVLNVAGSLVFSSFGGGGAVTMGSDSVQATLNLQSGSLLAVRQIANATADFTVAGTSATTTVNIDGGTLRALESRTTYLEGLTGGAFIRAGGATVDTNGFDITVGQPLRHDPALAAADGGLRKTGLGILTITGTGADYTGPTTVAAGTLLINAAGATGTGAVAVNAGATLGGTSSIAGPVSLATGAKLAPGASAGTLTVNNTLALGSAVNGSASGALVFEIGPMGGSDQVVANSITLGTGQLGLEDFAFSPLAGIGPGPYTLLTGVPDGSLGANTFAANAAGLGGYDAQLSQVGNQVILTLVPEPATALTLAAATLGLLARPRARRRR